MTKAFAYLRVSGKGQVDGDGFERQLAAIKAYAKANDIKIVDVFREEGVSGKLELEHRPALLALLEALAANGTRLVLIEKLDRLARDLMVQETLLSDLRKRDYQLISVAEPDLCNDDPTRILMRQIFGAIAQYEKTMIVAKLRGARQRMRSREGRCEGRKPFGERDGEAAAIAQMRSMRACGHPYDTVASMLNAQGFGSRSGKPWSGSTVRVILARS